MISPDLPFRDVLAFMCSNVVNFDFEIGLALKRDEEQVQAIVNHLNETMTDPFDIEAHSPCLMNISTGMHATREVQDSLLSAVNEGDKNLSFIALLNDARKCLVSVHLSRADF
jgi:hypothetical protein